MGTSHEDHVYIPQNFS